MRVRLFSTWLLAASSVFAAARASAGTPIELVYLRSGKAEACPDQATLEHAVLQRLGYNPFFTVAERKVVASISSSGGVLHARATLVDRGVVRGNRDLTAPVADCRELIASLALAISITLDPMILVSAEPDASSDSGASLKNGASLEPPPREESRVAALQTGQLLTAAPTPAPDISAARSSEVAPPRGAPVQLAVTAGMLATVGALPNVAPAWRIGLDARWSAFSMGIEAWASPSIAQSAPAGGEAQFSLFSGSIVPCFWLGRLGACGVVSLGRLTGEGSGVVNGHQESRLYAATGLRVVALLPLTQAFRLSFHVGGAATLTRPSFELDGAEIWRPPPLSADAGFALSFYFL